jgi:hypothetical protein
VTKFSKASSASSVTAKFRPWQYPQAASVGCVSEYHPCS